MMLTAAEAATYRLPGHPGQGSVGSLTEGSLLDESVIGLFGALVPSFEEYYCCHSCHPHTKDILARDMEPLAAPMESHQCSTSTMEKVKT